MKILFIEKVIQNRKTVEINVYSFNALEEHLNFKEINHFLKDTQKKIEKIEEKLKNYLNKKDTYNLNENIKNHLLFETLVNELIELKYNEIITNFLEDKNKKTILYSEENGMIALPLRLEEIKKIMIESLKDNTKLTMVEIENNLDKKKVEYKISRIFTKSKNKQK